MPVARLILLMLLACALGAADSLPISVDHGVVTVLTNPSPVLDHTSPSLWWCAGFVIAVAIGWALLIAGYSKGHK